MEAFPSAPYETMCSETTRVTGLSSHTAAQLEVNFFMAIWKQIITLECQFMEVGRQKPTVETTQSHFGER